MLLDKKKIVCKNYLASTNKQVIIENHIFVRYYLKKIISELMMPVSYEEYSNSVSTLHSYQIQIMPTTLFIIKRFLEVPAINKLPRLAEGVHHHLSSKAQLQIRCQILNFFLDTLNNGIPRGN